MSAHLPLGTMLGRGLQWLFRQCSPPTQQRSSGRKLDIGWCAVFPHQVHQMLSEHPDAVIAGEFLRMLEHHPDWHRFYESIAVDLLQLKAQHPDCDIYVHSPHIA